MEVLESGCAAASTALGREFARRFGGRSARGGLVFVLLHLRR
jgi:hypothetical protein